MDLEQEMQQACHASIFAIRPVEGVQAAGLALRAHCTAAASTAPAALLQTHL
jgi:hypothetical protein